MTEFNELPEIIETDKITRLEEQGHIEETETDGLFCKTDNKRLSHKEIQTLILPYVLLDVKVSDRKLAELTGIDRRFIAKVRNSDEFMYALLAETNKTMITVSTQALDELSKLLADPTVSPSVKQKLIATALQYRTDIMTIYVKVDKPLPQIDVDDLLA